MVHVSHQFRRHGVKFQYFIWFYVLNCTVCWGRTRVGLRHHFRVPSCAQNLAGQSLETLQSCSELSPLAPTFSEHRLSSHHFPRTAATPKLGARHLCLMVVVIMTCGRSSTALQCRQCKFDCDSPASISIRARDTEMALVQLVIIPRICEYQVMVPAPKM